MFEGVRSLTLPVPGVTSVVTFVLHGCDLDLYTTMLNRCLGCMCLVSFRFTKRAMTSEELFRFLWVCFVVSQEEMQSPFKNQVILQVLQTNFFC